MAIKKPMTAARERDFLKMAAPACAATLAFVIGAASPSVAFCAGLWIPGTIVTNLPDAFVLQYDHLRLQDKPYTYPFRCQRPGARMA